MIIIISNCKQKIVFIFFVVEVHILWAQHQVHHSSEEFNLTVGLRQSAMQGWCGFVSIIQNFLKRYNIPTNK